MARCPPRSERVLEQEAHHVVLGEELRHRAEVGAADLALGGIHLVFLLALPVLVDPAEAIVRGEDLLRERFHDRLEREPRLRGESKPHAGVVEAEDPRQDLGREASGDSPAIGLVRARGRAPRTRRASPALGSPDGSGGRSRRGSGRRAGDATARRRTPRAAARSTHPRPQLPALRPQPAPEILLLVAQMGGRLRLDHPKPTELGAAALLGCSAAAHTSVLERLA